MKLHRVRLAIVVAVPLLLVAGLVRAASNSYQDRQAEAFKAAMAKRKELGLDKSSAYERLRREYPTPEVMLGSGKSGSGKTGTVVVTCPDKTVKLEVPGTFQLGTSFIVQSNEVTVLSEKLTPKGWEASVRVPKDLPPTDVYVQVAAPVSFTAVTVPVLRIRCKLRLKLKLDGGGTLDAELVPSDDSDDLKGKGTWKPGGEVALSARGSGGGLSVSQEQSQEDALAGMERMQAALTSPKMQALEQRQEKAMAKLTACTQKPPAQMPACMDGPQKELEAINKEREALMAQGTAARVGCPFMNLTLKPGGEVTGSAQNCWDAKDHQVSGTYASP